MPQGFTVAIDGPAASGKGTIAKAVADHFGFAHLDTGLLYRAVGAQVLRGADAVAAAQAVEDVDLTQANLRTPEVADAASRVAAVPQVRAALVAFQRRFAARPGGAVLDGRDIGTVICPAAPVKLFVVAHPRVRAARRLAELSEKGIHTSFEDVLGDVMARDTRDRTRADAPMAPAPDAVEIDTSSLSIMDAIAAAVAVIDAKRLEAR
ncbi:MAG: d(CMP) kinase [Pseudomonadota bacterium]